MMMKNSQQATLADVDGTLLKGSLVLDHACYVHDKKIVNLHNLPDMWRDNPKDETLITTLAEAYRNSIIGLTADDIDAKRYVKEKVSNPNNFYSSIERLKEEKKNGSDVYLISGSPSFLLTPFARHFGFRSKGSLYRTDEDGRFSGEIVGMFNADAKRKHVRSLKVNERYEFIRAYGDTMSDLPLFQVAHFSVLVDPHANTLKNIGEVHEILHA